jgi:hypothetical protein
VHVEALRRDERLQLRLDVLQIVDQDLELA